MSSIPPNPPRERVRVQHPGGGREMVKQADKDATDINLIVKRWESAGQMPPINPKRPQFGDFGGTQDFHSALSKVRQAHDDFMELPSKVREAADNDPGVFLEMLSSEEGRNELFSLGLDEKETPERKDPPATNAGGEAGAPADAGPASGGEKPEA